MMALFTDIWYLNKNKRFGVIDYAMMDGIMRLLFLFKIFKLTVNVLYLMERDMTLVNFIFVLRK